MSTVDKQMKITYLNHLKELGLSLKQSKKYVEADMLILQDKKNEAAELINEIVSELIAEGKWIPEELLKRSSLQISNNKILIH
jgi:ribosomal protein L7/L12